MSLKKKATISEAEKKMFAGAENMLNNVVSSEPTEEVAEVAEDIATRRLNNAVAVVKSVFHLNDEYVVTAFKDGGKTIDLTLNNPEFTISVKIKDTEIYGIN